jgi:hypothetical protein
MDAEALSLAAAIIGIETGKRRRLVALFLHQISYKLFCRACRENGRFATIK